MTLPLGTIMAVEGLPELSDGSSDPWSVVKVIGHFTGAEETGPEPVVQCWDGFREFLAEDSVDVAPKAVSPVVLTELGYEEISADEAPARLKEST